MIKRRFYRYEHGSRDAPSDSSSSSDSEVEPESTEESDSEEEVEELQDSDDNNGEENIVADVRKIGEVSSSSGYESEDSSANEVNLDSSGLPTSDDDVAAENGGSLSVAEGNSILTDTTEKERIPFDTTDCVLKCKSVFKCKLCPRLVCLSEETIKAHLNSKRHARSEKLRKEGRLKLMLNDDGKLEGETGLDDDATPPVSRKKSDKPKKRGKGRWKHSNRSRDKREKRRKSDS